MKRDLESKLRSSLTECLREWWGNLDDELLQQFDAWTGGEVHVWMATAVLSVLAGIQDSQEFMADEGLLADE